MASTIQQRLQAVHHRLARVTDQPALEAEILLAYTLQQPRSYLYAWPEKQVTAEQAQQFHLYIDRRCNKEPIAYLTGSKAFWSLEFVVTPDTLIPRPETESLVEWVLALMGDRPAKIADLGTGCGAIGLSLAHERPAWEIHLTDQSLGALRVAEQNARRFLLNNVLLACGNWLTALRERNFDVIVSNPPYIAEDEWEMYAHQLLFEPRDALVSGKDGLQAIGEICREAKGYLTSQGYLLVEHGFRQGALVRDLFVAAGYAEVKSVCDLAGHERMTMGRLFLK